MRKILILALTAVLALGATACGGAKTVDMDALAAELYKADIYEDILTELPDGMAERFYDMDEGELTRSIVYYGTGATAEEIAILQCADKAASDKAMENARARVASQEASFADYRPAEVPKLENAVLCQSGVYVIVVVSNDAAQAQKIVDKYV